MKEKSPFSEARPLTPKAAALQREFLNRQWVTVDATWCEYPDFATSFLERMNTLRRLAGSYPHYSAALAAATAEVYVSQVSLSWSTDPQRGEKCIDIYRAHGDALTAAFRSSYDKQVCAPEQ